MDVIPLRPRRRRMRAWLAKRRLLPFLVGLGLAALAVGALLASRGRGRRPPAPDAPISAVPSGRCLELQEPKGRVACPYAAPPSPSPSPDFALRFEAGNVCEAVGRVNIQSGRVVATDPLVNIERKPFSHSIPPGKYPVYLAIDASERAIAFALVMIRQARPVRWDKADAGDGYFVDAGTGCFTDADTAAAISARDARSPEDWMMRAMDAAGYWKTHAANLCIDPATGANLVAFHSGIGDGVYPSYFGFDAGGAVVALVTDFRIVDLGHGRHPWLEALQPSP